MRRVSIWMVTSVLLGGCGASPAPQFFGAARHDVMAQGLRYAVFVKGDAVEVIRLDSIGRRDHARARAGLLEAAEAATGCRISGPLGGFARSPSLPGDSGEARYLMDC
ncbi:hypothetical protein LZA78_10505 [Sinirhodobacter sp. WL0062]|uniref:Lipoprotein n=1 Tax=Rhodobacter flavimaris TaxID=2907145 RepID=A0ABS8YWM1_9RHOB|nr:hypothetical protein [Sinirhodobacter sp. WL0062]MCE5973913.1 hypothetical protein [Sinirhodobacter sp. WL0062]